MTTTDQRPAKQPSLRALAAQLGVSHSSLSAAYRAGKFGEDDGLALDARGRLVVTDAAAAAECWRGIRAPRPGEDERAAIWKVAAGTPTLAKLVLSGGQIFTARNLTEEDLERHLQEWGHPMFNDLTRQDLLETWSTFDRVAHALVAAAIDGAPDRDVAGRELVERGNRHLRGLIDGDNVPLLEDAEALLGQTVAEVLNPDDGDDQRPGGGDGDDDEEPEEKL